MSVLILAQQVERTLADVDYQLNLCYAQGIDYTYLLVAKEALTQQLVCIKQSLGYQLEAYGYYGIIPDMEELSSLIEEVGYDQVTEAYGDELNELLAEVRRT